MRILFNIAEYREKVVATNTDSHGFDDIFALGDFLISSTQVLNKTVYE